MGTRIENLQVIKVADGDTISVRLSNKNESLRLVCVDTEEKSGSPKLPHTKAGQLATDMARLYFSAVGGGLVKVDLEFDTDDAEEVCLVKHRDNFGRLLCYVHKTTDNFNLKLIQEGWSPYFTKYGRSRVYQQEFTEAEASAQAGNLIIWNPMTNSGGGARNYTALIPWWGLRDSIVQDYRLLGPAANVISVRLDYQKILKASETGATLTILCDLQDGITRRVGDAALIKAGSDVHRFNLWLPDTTTDDGIAIINLIQKRYIASKQGVEDIGGRGYAYVTGRIEQHRGIPQIVLDNHNQITDFPPV
ncbi:MAG: thermonuclease family protein [Gammaproteobacteria bacterium]|nr:thermonuclease family protein [Gammaproteobacteria bacterium]